MLKFLRVDRQAAAGDGMAVSFDFCFPGGSSKDSGKEGDQSILSSRMVGVFQELWCLGMTLLEYRRSKEAGLSIGIQGWRQ